MSYVPALVLWATAQLLWQGTLAWIIARAWRATADARYRLAVGLVASFPLCVAASAVATHLSLAANARRGADGALVAHAGDAVDAIGRATDRAADLAPALVTVWLVGITVFAARLIVAHWRLAQARRTLVPAPPGMAARVGHLRGRVGLRTMPRVAVSRSGLAPCVIGARAPILVLPTVPLPEAELDALILHELAHIRRGDYAANWVLQVLAAIFWFHPAVHALVRAAADAREECCDTIAVAGHAAPLALASALVRLAELQVAYEPAVAATGRALVQRVERLAEPLTYRAVGRWRLAHPVLAVLLLYAAGAVAAARLAPASDRLMVSGAERGALPLSRTVIDAHDPAGPFTITFVNGRVAAATIGGRPVDRGDLRVGRHDIIMRANADAPAFAIAFDPRGYIAWAARPVRQ